MKRFIVIGLGNFGFYVAKTLYEDGNEVLAIDRNRDRVARIQDLVSDAMILDAIHKESLRGLGISQAEAIVVSMGDDISNSILTTLYLKELGARKIVAKCQDEDHARILEKLGAHEIIFPEKAMGQKVAKSLSRGNILDFIPLSEDYTIVEAAPPVDFVGKSLKELKLKTIYHVYIIAVNQLIPPAFILSPPGDFVVKDSDGLVLLGREKDIQQIKSLFR
ncbi:MAG: TrkA family potassium uptake protein [Deltaproteobacteria bacterium]|nr:TrkA family potassium uptake protein [Deltaproteobacteria bacterium]